MLLGFGHGEETGSGGGGAAASGPGCHLPLLLEHRGGSSSSAGSPPPQGIWEEQEGCVWETLGALRLSEAGPGFLGGGEGSLTREARSGL